MRTTYHSDPRIGVRELNRQPDSRALGPPNPRYAVKYRDSFIRCLGGTVTQKSASAHSDIQISTRSRRRITAATAVPCAPSSGFSLSELLCNTVISHSPD